MRNSNAAFKGGMVFFLSVMFFAFVMGTACAGEHKFSNGITFTYPDGYQATETKSPAMTTVSLMNMSDPMVSFIVALSENANGSVIPEGDVDEAEIKKSMPSGSELLTCKKTKVAGKDALLTETQTEANGVSVFSRSMIVVSGGNMISVTTAVMDKTKTEAARKTAESVENSLKF
jgi:hypothetical protein